MVIVVVLLCLVVASCGGSSAPAGPSKPSNPYTFTLTSSGVTPKTLTVPLGTRVLFVNNDSRPHDMESDPHPEHNNCPEIQLGLLTPGQSGETSNLVAAKTCGFHDHDNPPPTEAAGNQWTGRIVIQ